MYYVYVMGLSNLKITSVTQHVEYGLLDNSLLGQLALGQLAIWTTRYLVNSLFGQLTIVGDFRCNVVVRTKSVMSQLV